MRTEKANENLDIRWPFRFAFTGGDLSSAAKGDLR